MTRTLRLGLISMLLLIAADCTMKRDSPAQSEQKPDESMKRDSSTESDQKLDVRLRAAIRDPERAEKFVVVERATDGSVLVPVFVETRGSDATKKAIADVGGRVAGSTGERITAVIPLRGIAQIAALDEVVRIEASSAADWKPR